MNKGRSPKINKLIPLKFRRHRLTYKLVLLVVLCSFGLTLAASAIQLYADYRIDLNYIESNFKFFEKSHLPAISTSVYKVDIEQLRLQLDGALQLRDIIHIEVEEPRGPEVFKISRGDPNTPADMVRDYPLNFGTASGEIIHLGTIRVAASYKGAKDRLKDKIAVALVTNAVEIFPAAFIILAIFYYMVTRHITKISAHINDLKPDIFKPSMQLDRKKTEGQTPDELDHLVDSINGLLWNINEYDSYRDRSETAMRLSEANLRSFIDNTEDMICARDRSGALIFWNEEFNKACKNLFGIAAHAGLKTGDLIPPEQEENIYHINKSWQKVFAGENVRDDFMYTWPNGENHFFEANWSPIRVGDEIIGAAEITRDVTEKKLAEQKLLEAEERYRTVADFTYAWEYWESPEGQMLYVSPSCERISGYSAEEFINYPDLIQEIIISEDRSLWTNHKHEASLRTSPMQVDFRIHTKSGQVRWIEHACQPVYDSAGIFIGARVSNRDITNFRKMQEETQKLRAELTRIDRVNIMGVLTAGIAHEINQPLAAILSNAQAALRLMNNERQDLEEVKAALHDIISDDKRAGQLVHSIRNILGKYSLKHEELDLNATAREIMILIKSEALNRKILISDNLQPDIPSVSGDRIQIQQVILNLLMNSLEAFEGDLGSVPEITLSTLFNDKKDIILSVSDNGPGIHQDRLNTIFESFETTKKTGLGIGLSICRSIIEHHGGHIWAENRPEGGAILSFRLPSGENGND